MYIIVSDSVCEIVVYNGNDYLRECRKCYRAVLNQGVVLAFRAANESDEFKVSINISA